MQMTQQGPPADVQLQLPSSLTARQRAIVHAIGDEHGIPHTSKGQGEDRYMTLGSSDAAQTVIINASDIADDGTLAAIIQKNLCIILSPEAFSPAMAIGTNNERSANAYLMPKAANSMKLGADGRNIAVLTGSVPDFVGKMQDLLHLERRAEVEAAEESLSSATPAQAESRGRVIVNLRLADAESGLLGRTLLKLERNKPGEAGDVALPPHKFAPHDIVRIRAAKGEAGGGGSPTLAQGVVYRVTEKSIIVAVDDVPDDGLDVPLKLEKLANEVTFDRLQTALQQLRSTVETRDGPAVSLIDVLFSQGHRTPRFASTIPPWIPLNSNLDPSQREAVTLALAAADIALIQGPPGTGKTTTVVELIGQEVMRGARVLACAASNIAVDNLVERLASQMLPSIGGSSKKRPIKVVRVGHPARLLPQVLDSSLESKVLRSDDSALARDCRREMKELNARLFKLGRKDRAERTQLRRDLRQLGKEERQRQERAVTDVLASASVVCTTLTGVGVRHIEKLPPFDVVVIDEAAQALEPACWAALLRGRKAVLVGDHLQLPPTVTSEAAARGGLAVTLFERSYAVWGSIASKMLTVQYRMHADIMTWSSEELYGGKLEAHASVAAHTLHDLSDVKDNDGNCDHAVLQIIDTSGCDLPGEETEGDGSKLNRGEAAVTMAVVRRLLDSGMKPIDIGVITPYAAQVGLLREMRPESVGPSLEISTVDGFQGREKEAIVISMVRCNTMREIGFLSDKRRMNVAVTRARRQCTLVCNVDTVGADPFLKRLVDYFMDHGEYFGAEEYDVNV